MTDLLLEAIRQAVRDELRLQLAPLAEVLARAVPVRGYSPAEFARLKGLSQATVYRRVADGTLAHRKLGGRVVIPGDALDPPSEDKVAARARVARQSMQSDALPNADRRGVDPDATGATSQRRRGGPRS